MTLRRVDCLKSSRALLGRSAPQTRQGVRIGKALGYKSRGIVSASSAKLRLQAAGACRQMQWPWAQAPRRPWAQAPQWWGPQVRQQQAGLLRAQCHLWELQGCLPGLLPGRWPEPQQG